MSRSRWHLGRARLTEEELDRALSAADRDLMAYLRKTVDPTKTLLAIMELPEEREAAPVVTESLFDCSGKRISDTDAASIIMERTLARDVLQDLHDAQGLLQHEQCEEAMRYTRRSLKLAIRLINDAESTEVASRAVGLATLALDIDLIRDLVRNLTHTLDADLTRELGDGDLERAKDLARALNVKLRNDKYGASFVGAVGVAIETARSLALNLVDELDGIQVDASQADLSGIALSDINALTSVTWTRFTIWPHGVTERLVRRFSDEIGPGMFRVHERINQDERRLVLI